MPEELQPDDAVLLSRTRDEATGVDYIPTGRSPYVLEYRRSLHRTLRVAERAGDLRVYADGDLTVGVKPGRCYIGETAVAFAGADAVAVTPDTVTTLWLDAAGVVQTSTDGLPADRATFIPLARVAADTAAIDTITDLRGEAFLQAAGPASLGLVATADEINQALSGIDPSVTDSALNRVTGGPLSDADLYHTHTSLSANEAGEAKVYLTNNSLSPTADLSVRFSVPERYLYDTVLKVNPDHHLLEQRYGSDVYTLVGAASLSYVHAGTLTASLTNHPLGPVPITGRIVAVVLSVADNLQSSDTGDGLTAAIDVNGTPATQAPASLSSADGPGFACTDRGDGTSATLNTDGSAGVSRGDLLTLNLTRTAAGTVTQEAVDIAVLVVVRAARPE
ncbi:MAG: hypothetical protein AAF800_09485 [Planctomycetota bacterium]